MGNGLRLRGRPEGWAENINQTSKNTNERYDNSTLNRISRPLTFAARFLVHRTAFRLPGSVYLDTHTSIS